MTLGVGFGSPFAYNKKHSRTHTSKQMYTAQTRRRYADVPLAAAGCFVCAVSHASWGAVVVHIFPARGEVNDAFSATTLAKLSPWKGRTDPKRTNDESRAKYRIMRDRARSGAQGSSVSPTKGVRPRIRPVRRPKIY